MNCMTSFYRKTFFMLILTLLFATNAYSNDFVSVVCIDIESSPNSSRALELAVSSVNEKYFSLTGTHMNEAGVAVGSSVGSALMKNNNELIVTVNASSADDSTMESTLYQFNFDLETLNGTYKAITQQSINGTFVPLDYKSGKAAVVSSCDAPTTNFSNVVDEPVDEPVVDEPAEPGDPGSIFDRYPEDNVDPDADAGLNYASFTDNGDGTLSQNGTNLVWQQGHDDNDPKINWFSATRYCENLTLGDSTNWRLPTRTELEGIVDDRYVPTIDRKFTADANFYWSSTDYPGTAEPNFVYDVNFGTGEYAVRGKGSSADLTRCVR